MPTKQPSRPKVVARRLAAVARFADDEHAGSAPVRLRAPLSTRAFLRLSAAERLDTIRTNVAAEVDRERERLAEQHRAEAAEREAAQRKVAATASSTTSTTTTSATQRSRATLRAARWTVSCACGCGAMLPAPGPRPLLRRHDGAHPRGR